MASEKIPFTMENIKKCQCGKCPIQGESTCAQSKLQMMMKMMQQPPSPGMMIPQPEGVPGMYCSTGKATCTDLDYTKMCICGSCPIWTEYKLMQGKPMGYFCRDGKAE
jgi:hypothetical protein